MQFAALRRQTFFELGETSRTNLRNRLVFWSSPFRKRLVAAEISFVVSSDQRCHSSHGLRWLEWLNFFLADIQTGVGPFLAAYLATTGWNPGRVGLALTFGGVVTVALQTPAGAVIDSVHRKRA